MKSLRRNSFLLPLLIAGLAWLPARCGVAQTYTFGTQVQSTNTASITYNSGTGTFQYTDAENASDDNASLPLTGNATNLISYKNAWHASVTINVSARTMTATSTESPGNGIGLSVIYVKDSIEYYVSIVSGQANNSGGASQAYPDGLYGTGAHFLARIDMENQVTTPLGSSLYQNGDSLLVLTGGTNTPAQTESVGVNNGVVSLSYDPAGEVLTGYYNSIPVGSYSVSGWSATPSLNLYVFGSSGPGVEIAPGTDTATNFNVGPGTFTQPHLSSVLSGTDFVFLWPTNATGFVLQSTTNLSSPSGWTRVATTPEIVSTNNAVTNHIGGSQVFFRLEQD
jgi:hypothetical protein